MKRVVAVAGSCVALAACGGGDELRGVGKAVVSCDARTVLVAFDPTASVEVTSGDRTLAIATFTERRLNGDCPDAAGPDVRRDDGLDRRGIYRRADLECRLRDRLHIRVNPIFDADVGRSNGSAVVVFDGDSVVAAAVLKNEGDPKASRVYRAPKSCSEA